MQVYNSSHLGSNVSVSLQIQSYYEEEVEQTQTGIGGEKVIATGENGASGDSQKEENDDGGDRQTDPEGESSRLGP